MRTFAVFQCGDCSSVLKNREANVLDFPASPKLYETPPRHNCEELFCSFFISRTIVKLKIRDYKCYLKKK